MGRDDEKEDRGGWGKSRVRKRVTTVKGWVGRMKVRKEEGEEAEVVEEDDDGEREGGDDEDEKRGRGGREEGVKEEYDDGNGSSTSSFLRLPPPLPPPHGCGDGHSEGKCRSCRPGEVVSSRLFRTFRNVCFFFYFDGINSFPLVR